MNTAVQIGKMRMKNPVTTASGTFGYGPEYAEWVDLDALGAITVKGIAEKETMGNQTPRTFETSSGMINAIGLPGPGAEKFCQKNIPFLNDFDVPLIVNIWGKTEDEYGRVAARFNQESRVDAMEVNVSCPNVKEGGASFGTDLKTFASVVNTVRAQTDKTIIIKLAPNVPNVADFAKAAEDCGADAVSMMNSFPSMAINIETRKYEIWNKMGGLSGPAIRPIAIKLVHDTYQAVKIPIIGMGGIYTARDAIEFMMAGATAVAVGTANFTNPTATIDVIAGIQAFMKEHNISDVNELVGAIHN